MTTNVNLRLEPEKDRAIDANMRSPKAVKIFAGLIDCGQAAVRTWFHLRGLDRQGQGWVDIEISDIANRQGSSRATIYRHLSNKIFFPQVLKAKEGKIRVYLNGLANVCIAVGIDSVLRLGACTEFLVEWLGDRMVSVIYATELEAQNGQRQAYREALKSQKEDETNQILDPGKAVTMLSKAEQRLKRQSQKEAKRAGRSVVNLGFKPRSFRFFRIRPNQNVPGITQLEISQRSNRSKSTTQRRLSNHTRTRYGIAPLNRRRVLQELSPAMEKHFDGHLDHIGANFAAVDCGGQSIQVGRFKIGEEKYQVYRLLTNIYEFDFALLPSKRARARLKRLVKRIKEQCHTA